MAIKITTTITEITMGEMKQEVLKIFQASKKSLLSSDDVSDGLKVGGIHFNQNEMSRALFQLLHEDILDATEVGWRLMLPDDPEYDSNDTVRTHYLGDGCDPAHTLPGDDDPNMCHGLPGRD